MKQNNNIPQGYKDSPLGIIPREWEVKKLRIISDKIGSGVTPTGGESVYKKSGRYFLRSQNVGWGVLLLDDVAFIDEKTHSKQVSTEIRKNDILLNITGASIGRCAIANQMIEGGNVNQHVCIIRVNQQALPYFINSFLLSYEGQKLIDSFQAGGNRQGLNFEQIKSFNIPIPPLPEQQKIAEVLSVWDEAIEKQTRLIAQFEIRKRGLMQQLLSGGKRVKGFSGKWEDVKLGKICDIRTGNRNNEDKVENGLYPFFVRSQNIERINSYSFDCEAILIPGEGKIGEVIHYINGRFDFHQRVYKISHFSNVNAKYIYYYLNLTFAKQAINNSVKACVDSLRLPTFTNMVIKIPSLEEQTAIANILSSADNEIDFAKQKLAKLKEQKKGLMQVLLTGKKRVKI